MRPIPEKSIPKIIMRIPRFKVLSTYISGNCIKPLIGGVKLGIGIVYTSFLVFMGPIALSEDRGFTS